MILPSPTKTVCVTACAILVETVFSYLALNNFGEYMCKNHHKYEIICSLKNLTIMIIFIISVATY